MFITFEGTEGVGKSTQLDLLAGALARGGSPVVTTREPGGTATGEAIRDLLLHREDLHVSDDAELLLMFAARAQHLVEVVRPALNAGKLVLCDRFTDATYAYQGGGRGMDRTRIAILENSVQGGLRPDLTFLLDAPVPVGMDRARDRGRASDRFERERAEFFERVRSAYLEIAAAEPGRVVIVDAARPRDVIHAEILARVRQAIPET